MIPLDGRDCFKKLFSKCGKFACFLRYVTMPGADLDGDPVAFFAMTDLCRVDKYDPARGAPSRLVRIEEMYRHATEELMEEEARLTAPMIGMAPPYLARDIVNLSNFMNDVMADLFAAPPMPYKQWLAYQAQRQPKVERVECTDTSLRLELMI